MKFLLVETKQQQQQIQICFSEIKVLWRINISNRELINANRASSDQFGVIESSVTVYARVKCYKT